MIIFSYRIYAQIENSVLSLANILFLRKKNCYFSRDMIKELYPSVYSPEQFLLNCFSVITSM